MPTSARRSLAGGRAASRRPRAEGRSRREGRRRRIAIIARCPRALPYGGGALRAFCRSRPAIRLARSGQGEKGRRSGPRSADNPGGAREAQGGDRASLDREAPRGRRADQGGARVRRHRRELRVRRRQERAGPARAADRPARGAPAPRQRRRSEVGRHRAPSASVSGSTSRTRSPASRASSRSSARPRRAPASRSSRTSRRSARALLGHKRGDIVTVDVPRGPKKKLKITKIETA